MSPRAGDGRGAGKEPATRPGARRTPHARGRIIRLAAVAGGAAMLAAALLGGCGAGKNGAGATASASAASAGGSAIPVFNGDSAWGFIRTQVSFGPRVPGTPAHARQLKWMVDYLKPRADTVIVQRFTHRLGNGHLLPLANVFARFKPAAKNRVLILAHWDTRPISDQDPDSIYRDKPIMGANDGGSGVAVLMELADVFHHHSPPIGVDLLFTDGEDYASLKAPEKNMYLGADYFAAHMPPDYKPLYGVLVDMVGDLSPSFPVEVNSERYAPEVVDRIWRTAKDIGYGSMFPREGGMEIIDDHLPLIKAGIHTADIIDFDYGPDNSYWHTHLDTLNHTSPRGLKAVGQVLTTLIFQGG